MACYDSSSGFLNRGAVRVPPPPGCSQGPPPGCPHRRTQLSPDHLVMSWHGADWPITITIGTNDALGPGCMASFVAVVMVSGTPAPWQCMTPIQGQHARVPSAFRRGQKSVSSRPAGAKRWSSDVKRGLCDWGGAVLVGICSNWGTLM